uniref:MFS domain-containing protein n=1 Tax=Ascaris lumbricoides TaxID=6252 RepID=A0A0M3HPS3_ASCLU
MSKFPGLRLFVVSVIVSFGGSFHFGYQLVITNPSQSAFLAFLNSSFASNYGSTLDVTKAETIWSVIVAILFVGAIVGSLSLELVGEKLGRKRGMYLSFTITTIAVAASMVSFFINSFELYSVSRVLTGYSLGLSLGLIALYLNESSPKECRGFVSMMVGVMVQFGTVIGSILAMPSIFGTTNDWWHIYLVECIIVLFVLLALPFMPESPGYLMLCGDETAARKSILFFRCYKPDEVDAVLHEIKENLKQNAKALSVFQVWNQRQTRKGTIVGMAISLSMAFSGIAVINAYAVEILKESGLSLSAASIGNIILSALAIVMSSFTVDRYGRRPLILISNWAILLLNVTIVSLMYCFNKFHYSWIGYTLVAIISLFIIFFAIGPGPLCYFITAEMVGQSAKAAAQSWASFTQMSSRALVLAIYLPIANQIGQAFAYLSLFIAPTAIGLIFLYFNMPETKNKNHNEVLEAVTNLPSVSKILRPKSAAVEPHDFVASNDFSCAVEKF